MNMEPIERFIKRVKGAAVGRSKDVRLTTEEAQELVATIGELLAEQVRLLQQKPSDIPNITVKADGGGF